MQFRTPIALAITTILCLVNFSRGDDKPVPTSGLKTVAGGSVQYHLSLPQGWSPQSTWPILVTIDGSGHNFAENHSQFVSARAAHPFILVTPCVSSNGKDPADLQAVLAIVQEVQKSAQGQPKFFITGFSAGGHVAWQCIFNHPELLAGAAPAAGNFRFRGVEKVSQAPERVKLPIHGFLGDKDGVRQHLKPQWDDAVQLARENGYENLTLTEVPDADHQAFPKQVVAFFVTLLPPPK